MIVRMKNTFRMLLAAMLLSLFALPGYSWQKSFPEKDYVAYLFTYFTGNSGDEEAVRYAVSMDGYTYWALNDNEPVIDSKVISSTGGVRDPHILRCEDGKTFYMVVTDMVSANGWSSNRAMVLLKSTDLVNWSHSVINIQKRYYRNGLYYFMWSVDDTGSPNYHVAYGTSKSPLGPIEVAKQPVVLIQNPEKEIYGPAHNAVLQIPGTDEWRIVYHRINKWYLKDGPGVHREVCIDRMEFNEDGTIKPVVPTL